MTCRVALVALVVPDYDDAIGFYVDILGFDLLSDEDRGNGKRWVTVAPAGGGTAILLARAVTAMQMDSIGNQTGGRVDFFLETDDFDRDHESMTKAGVTFEEAPRLEPYAKVAVWRDPFGNRWDLLQPREYPATGEGASKRL